MSLRKLTLAFSAASALSSMAEATTFEVAPEFIGQCAHVKVIKAPGGGYYGQGTSPQFQSSNKASDIIFYVSDPLGKEIIDKAPESRAHVEITYSRRIHYKSGVTEYGHFVTKLCEPALS
ncbi:MAG: hypothetical protein WAZ18_06215 [Alphaproteobacteria bacterium]